MPTVKGKSSSMGQRYTPVSEFDDATLAQKREYWRKKKREQRARRSEKKGTASKPSLHIVPSASSFPLHNKTTNLPDSTVRSLQTGNGTLTSCQTQFELNPCSVTNKIEVKCVSQINKNPALISQLNRSSSVPPLTKNHSLQPRVSVRIPSLPNSQSSPIPVFIQPKTMANIASVSSPCSTKSTPQLATNSALAKQQRPTNASISPAKVETEEEKAARRRELWRIKKREQRAKLADRLGKTKNRAQNVQKPHSGNPVPVHIPPQSLTQSGSLGKIEKLQTNIAPSFQAVPSLVVVKRPFEPIRKSPSPFHLSGVVRARCPTPWQNFIKQKLLKLKSPSSSYLYGCKGLPPIEPGDTPEQVISKRREYWRVKKREQRAKLSVEVKTRLRERADLQRRAKRYHKILEDMRKARSQSIMHASETIGGFIKEDGTVTINIPQVTVNFSTQTHRSEQVDNVGSYRTQPHVSEYNLQPPLPPCVPAKMLMGQKTNKQHVGAYNSSQKVHIQTLGSHLTLTHPPAALSAGATTGGCVMKMAVSCKAPALSKAYLDPSLTEEERMAKKREYWRTKKREQRAARAVRLRQGLSQARASAVLLKRKAQKHVTSVSLSRRLPKQSGGMTNNNMAYVNEMKQLSEFVPAVDLNLNQAICPELQPPMSRTPPPAQADPDPALSADNQATTLLAVASMKKLLEESLSSVSECQPETGIKIEAEEEKLEEDIKPDVSQVDICAPITADVMLQTDTQINKDTSFETKDFSQITSSCAPHCPPENSTQAPSYSVVHPKIEPSECFQRRTPRFKKAGHQHCCSPEHPKLHHPPIEMFTEIQAQHHSRAKCPQVLPCGLNSLQQKREYWKLMKRQQRARLKARQRNSTNMLSHRSVQSAGSGCSLNKSSVMKPTLLPKPCAQSRAASANMPAVLLVSPSTSNAGPQSTLRVKSPVSSRDSDTETRRKSENRNMTISPASLPTLKPPDNPLPSVNMLPIEPPGHNITRNLRSITIPCPPKQSTPCPVKSVSNLIPPKPIPGESDEDFQKRKREYWRIKKKEQRARKAIQDKDKSPHPSCSQNLPQYMPQESLQAHCEQESNAWMSPSVHSEDPINQSPDSDDGSFSFPSYSVPLDGGYDYEGQSSEEGALSGDFWRNHYLMDYDPLNQLLVCIVCGDLQYVHTIEAVRGHIEEAHPHTLSLESGERRRILQAWDEQVFHRERFFTNQLQQHSASMTEAHMN